MKSVMKGEHIPRKIQINEITLREESAFDVELTLEEKVLIAKKLDELGVHQIQIHSGDAKKLVPAIKQAGVKAKIGAFCQPFNPFDFIPEKAEKASWIDEVDECKGADILWLDYQVHPTILENLGRTKDNLIRSAVEGITYGKKIGFKDIYVVMPFAASCDVRYMIEITKPMVKAGATAIEICDTGAVMRPATYRSFIEQYKKGVGVAVATHCHNDFGLATANTLAAVEGGAEILDGIMNGSDLAHSQSAPLEEVVMALKCLYGIDLGIKTQMFAEVSELFSKLSNVPVHFLKPVVGSWVGSLTKREHMFQAKTKSGRDLAAPFEPESVGRKKWMRIGRHSGPIGIKTKLQELGMTAPDDKIPTIRRAVHEMAVRQRSLVTDEQFRELVKKLT